MADKKKAADTPKEPTTIHTGPGGTAAFQHKARTYTQRVPPNVTLTVVEDDLERPPLDLYRNTIQRRGVEPVRNATST